MRIYTSTTFICAWHPQLMITEWPQGDLFPHIELWMQQTNVILEYKWKTEIYFVQWGRRERRNYDEEKNQRVGDHQTSLEERLLHGCSVRIIILSARWLLMSWYLFGPCISRNHRIAVKALKRNPHSIDSNGDNYPPPQYNKLWRGNGASTCMCRDTKKQWRIVVKIEGDMWYPQVIP